MRRYIIVALVLCVLVGVACAWPASMESWDYRKEITINNTGANLTNYQVLFTVNRSAGSDSGFTTYLNGKCESDYDDIRFTTSDENTLCDYWIESSSSTVATIWVEVPSIVNSTAYGSTTMYLYYGNVAASAVSDGDATFPFFDDFLGSSLSASWSDILGSGVSVGSGVLSVDASSAEIYGIASVANMGTNIAVRARIKPNHYGSASYVEGLQARHGDDSNYNAAFYAHIGSTYKQKYSQWLGGASNQQSIAGGSSDWFIQEAKMGASSTIWSINGGSVVNHSTDYYGTSGKIRIFTHTSGGKIECDWILVRKYTATEPTVSAWGREDDGLVILLSPDFSGVPTSGYIPLTVHFNDLSTSENCTITTWQWSFGDSTANSTQQNPAHTYTTSGLYNVILTITNTSFSLTNSTQKSNYINVTINEDVPVADFTAVETCGNVGDTFYFIDFSTGGGLYAWNWSFGDGSYSELRNPTHQYASEGTYDVNLSVLGAYGSDSLLRENLITIPCGAATPTPTPTVTPTGGGNVTEGNVTYIYAPDQDYVPFPIWLALVIITIALFGHSLIFLKNSDLTAIMAALFAMVSAWLSNMIGYIDVQVTSYAEEIVISPVVQAVHPPWLVWTMMIFAFVSVMNIFAAIYKVYLKPVPWNEIYDRKLPKWERRK